MKTINQQPKITVDLTFQYLSFFPGNKDTQIYPLKSLTHLQFRFAFKWDWMTLVAILY